MTLDVDDCCAIVGDYHQDWELIDQKITYHSRWTVSYEAVAKHKESGKHYMFDYDRGATEYQDMGCSDMFGYSETYEPVEVQQVERLMKVWESIPKENA